MAGSGSSPRFAGRAQAGRGFKEHDLVQVRSRFDGTWCHGFEVAERGVGPDTGLRYRLRQSSDGHLLPPWFPAADVATIASPGWSR
jgi:hypothetical protein